MNHSFAEFDWTNEAFGARYAATVPAPPAADSSLCAQLEPFLGEDCPPDPAFFVESWTLGVAAAAENLRRRHMEPKRADHQSPALSTLNASPVFFSSADWLQAATVPLPQQCTQQSAQTAGLGEIRDGLPARFADDQLDDLLAGPLSLDRARRLLGVAANSTRDQIRAAYRQLAGRYHPDRHATQGDQQRRFATERMASINEAYRLLCAGRLDPVA